ncbi:MAG: AraC family ligand binding domain-containing protein, partial [Eubacteriales bacterium]|nr:AraC family ligand binding domain-containing protein [Eubacteriales bacterium]
MRSLEPYVSPTSVYYNFSPSLLAREHLLYVVCAGDFTYVPGYELTRSSFDSYLMEIILEGRVNIETEGERLTARAGQAVLIDCNKPHRYHSDTGWHALWVHFDGAPAKGYFSLILRQNGRVFATHRLQEAHEALQGIFDMFHQGQPLSETRMALYLTQALTALSEPAEPAMASGGAGLIDRAVELINRRVGEEPSVTELARMVGLSEYHF